MELRQLPKTDVQIDWQMLYYCQVNYPVSNGRLIKIKRTNIPEHKPSTTLPWLAQHSNHKRSISINISLKTKLIIALSTFPYSYKNLSESFSKSQQNLNRLYTCILILIRIRLLLLLLLYSQRCKYYHCLSTHTYTYNTYTPKTESIQILPKKSPNPSYSLTATIYNHPNNNILKLTPNSNQSQFL